MFHGYKMFNGAPFISNLNIMVNFLTILIYLSKEDNDVFFLDVAQSLFCWPTLFQGLLITFCLWSFRYLERILGQLMLITYLIYNMISYLPLYSTVILFKGFRYHISLFLFIPFSFFTFTIWRIPGMNVYKQITDKSIITTVMFIIYALSPFQCTIALLSSIIGYNLWKMDVFKLSHFFKSRTLQYLESEIE